MQRSGITPSRHTQRRPVKHTPRKNIYAPPPLHEADDHRLNLTSEQRQVRRETALHEATHLGVALALSGSWQRAFIRVPGKTPVNYWGHRGALGNIDAHHDEPFEEGCIMLAGLVVESLNADHEEAYLQLRSDLLDFEQHASRLRSVYDPVSLDFDDVLASAFRHVVGNWAGIDAIAAGLLHLGRSDGVVTRKKVVSIVEYYRSGQWVGRATWRPAPTSGELTMLLDVIRRKQFPAT